MSLIIFIIFEQFILTVSQEGVNLALGKYTNSSPPHSAYYPAPPNSFLDASLAVDGMRTPNNSMCFTSDEAPNLSWMGIDLEKLTKIEYVIIYSSPHSSALQNFSDVDNLEDFVIDIANDTLAPSLSSGYAQNSLCGQNNGTVLLNSSVRLNCPESTPPTRFVIIQKSSSDGYLVICEIEVYGKILEDPIRKNLLLKKPANASSVWIVNSPPYYCGKLGPEKIVDGFHATELIYCHCAGTNGNISGPNWYVVDMIGSYKVDVIVVTTSNGSPWPNRMKNFLIGTSDLDASVSPPFAGSYPLCGRYPGDVADGAKVSMKCNANLKAYRYLIAQQDPGVGYGGFAICELEAYAVLDEDKFLWRKTQSTASTKLEGYKFATLNLRSLQQCIMDCKKYGGCDSVDYENNLKLCQLNRHANGYSNTSLVITFGQDGWHHWEVIYAYDQSITSLN